MTVGVSVAVTDPSKKTSVATDAEARQGLFDKLGIGVSLTCAVHCVITALVSLLPTLGFSAATGEAMEWLELPLLVGALGIGLFALVRPYLHEHKNVLPVVLFSIGMMSIVASRFAPGLFETVLTVVGIAFVATAHVVNLRLHAAHHVPH